MVQHLSPADEPLAQRSYAPHFAALAVGLVAVTGWTVWDEAYTKRPWKEYQLRFQAEARTAYQAELAEARKELELARETPQYAEARASLEAAQEQQQSPEARAQRGGLEAELTEIHGGLETARQRFQVLRGVYQETAYRYEHSRSAAFRTRLQQMEPEIDLLSGRMAELQQRKKELLQKLRSGEEDLEKARTPLARFEERVQRTERALTALRQEKIEIRQVVNARLNLVDRCTSCHLGVARAGLEGLPQPFRTHPAIYLRRDENGKSARDILKSHPLETSGCVSCHQGQGYATASVEEAHGEVEYWLTPLLRGERVWGSCQKCHDAQPDLAGVERGWEGRRLVASYGCYACHKLPGFEQEAAVRIGPNLNVLGKKVYAEWVPLWLKDPHAFRPATRMPNMLLSEAERQAISAYLLQVGNNTAASPPPPAPPAAEVAAGRELFESVGCLACHSVGGRGSRFAPDLTRVGEKVRPAYLREWLRNPPGVQQGATMPNLRLTDSEIAKLTAYLTTLRQQASLPPLDFDPGDQALAARGKALITRYNCFGCHRIPGLEGRPSLVPDLTTVGSKLIEEFDFGLKRKPILAGVGLHDQRNNVEQARFAWIYTKLKDPRGYDEGRYKKPEESLRMPNFRLPDAEARTIATFLAGLTADSMPAEFREPASERSGALAAGAEVVRKYNCTGCHAFGVEQVVLRDGTLLEGSTKLREEGSLFFLLWHDSSDLGRSAGEIVAVAEKDVLTHSPAPGGDIVPIVVERVLQKQGLSLDQAQQDPAMLVKAEEARAFAPPVLYGEGKKVRPAWLFDFLSRPVTLRPWLGIRMPSFPLTEQETRTLVRYFAAVDRQAYPFEREEDRDPEVLASREAASPGYLARAQRLFSHSDVNCSSCHVRGVIKPQGDASGWAPDLSLAHQRLRPTWIADWLTDPQRLYPGTKMPTFFPAGEPRYQEVFPGEPAAQIRALRDYVLTIGSRARVGGAAVATRVSAGGQP